MLFSSMTFIFLFLPITGLAYFATAAKWKNYVLLVASIFFYAWGEPKYVTVMLATIVINYLGARGVEACTRYKKYILAFAVLANLLMLFYFKYFNFLLENINVLFTAQFDFIKVVMPIGISFYTFQAMSYLVDVYRQEVPVQENIFKLALYICLFPQLIAGPIIKYKDVAAQIENRQHKVDNIVYGVKRFILGLSKKVLLANTLGEVADMVFAQPIGAFPVAVAWLGAVAYSFQLFYDFSGYSDMAIGLGYIFGFKFLENFNYPYISRSITEFWRRWHISLSSWFKNYVYIPLGGNRKGKMRTYVNLSIVFLATGIWHGACWTFVVWGIWHGFFIILEKTTGLYSGKNKVITVLQHFYALLIVVTGWVIFRADNLAYAYGYIKTMFGFGIMPLGISDTGYYIDTIKILAFVCAAVCAGPLFTNMTQLPHNKWKHVCINVWMLCLFLLSVTFIAAATYNPFIYFRF